jgi:hypothetical protein
MSRSLLYTFAAILAIKAAIFIADSRPAYFEGDSGAYLSTATAKYIPPDRSFMYGLFLRRTAYRTHSLNTIVWTQIVFSVVAAWLLAFTLENVFSVRPWLAAAFGILCSIEPLQLLSERYLLTECCANFLFALYFVLSLLYLKKRKLWILAVVQFVGVLLVSFRISFLPGVLICSLLLPLLSRIRTRQMATVALHLSLSILVSLSLFSIYEHWYGRLIRREPALFYQNGAFLVAAFSPLIEPEDFPLVSSRDPIFQNLRFDRHDLANRPAQHFVEGGLWPNIQNAIPDEKQANDAATAAAIHALLRQPIRAGFLAFKTLRLYFDINELRYRILEDEGKYNTWSPTIRDWLENIYGVRDPQPFEPSLTKRWHQLAIPWYWLILCALILSPLMLFAFRKADRPPVILLVVFALLFLSGATLTVDRVTPRFLTSAAWLVLLMLGIVGAGFSRSRAAEGGILPPATG